MASSRPPAIPDPIRDRRPGQPRREDLAPGECLCDHCSGKCCRYFSLPMDEPTTWDDFDAACSYLAHGRTLIYAENGKKGKAWYLVVMTRCRYLGPDERCRIYFSRPKICREYTTAECEYDEDWEFEKVFETPEQLREYAEATLPRRSQPRPIAAPGPFFTHPIDEPTTWDDFDAARWYLAHGRTLIYVEKGKWYLVVMTRCQHLGPEERRRIDFGRPGINREYTTAECGYDEDGEFEQVFETPEQLWEYAEAILPRRRRPRPPAGPALTVISAPG